MTGKDIMQHVLAKTSSDLRKILNATPAKSGLMDQTRSERKAFSKRTRIRSSGDGEKGKDEKEINEYKKCRRHRLSYQGSCQAQAWL